MNQVAETIAKINKLEDFTKQQDYIKKCAELLRIEESGLVNLVNKFIREKVAKDEAKQQQQQPTGTILASTMKTMPCRALPIITATKALT